ncbi:MAG: serine hydrolase [Bacteroidetes bacterium]|nr:MAG: serine hydrolase [Bacteroidota bacterium]
MINLRRSACFCITILIAATSARSQTPSFITDSLDSFISRGMKNWQIPGLSICVIKDGKIVVMKGYGVKKIGGDEKVNENTLFMIGSNSKIFTATLLALLHYENKLSLDDKVTKWIPEFKLDNKAAGEQAIIRDLLCHRIGFRTFQGDFTYWTSDLTRSQVIEKMSHIKAAYPFRTTWGYTNAAFLTAGEIIPRAIGKSWEIFVKERIFDPLGMNSTLALSRDFPSASNKAVPHTFQDGQLISIPYCQIDNLAPAGSISSSVYDMSKWIMTQLGNGKWNGVQVIPASVIAETRKPHSIQDSVENLFNHAHFLLYGLGLELTDYEGKEIISHTGGVNGFVSSVTMIPEEKLGIVVLTNTDENKLYQSVKWEIIDAYLKVPFRNYDSAYLSNYSLRKSDNDRKNKQWSDSASLQLKTPLALSAYTGNYFNEVYGNMKVVMEDGELRMKFSHHPAMYASLRHIGNNRFYAIFSDPEFGKSVFPFEVENGKVKSVTVKVADFIEYDPYVFRKSE